MSDPHTNLYCPTTFGYWVTSTEYLITFSFSETVTAHAPCHVTSNQGKNSPHFWNLWSQFTYLLCHFQGATTKIKPCYGRKIAFIPLWRLQSLLPMRSITWPVHRRSPKTTRNNIWPRITYSLYNFYGATMTIKGSLYWSFPMLKRFSVAKTVQSKSVPKMADFRTFKGLNRKYSHRDPKPGTTHLTYFA